jgi:hypothetical protein
MNSDELVNSFNMNNIEFYEFTTVDPILKYYNRELNIEEKLDRLTQSSYYFYKNLLK